ncbi:sulfate permease 2 [Pseudomassariella vexata]|uniref:Sulfate permease 2 n=1 Tax=Pseudomassariella vexata TaxID=1141098 RepID=A0A1Y2DRQ5_9PEZI|nr:sulfate permease 2 [Pseudomassariella vexata]ORY61786.1 sulfate permease 2 [Pseudomassariella vexata]
MSSQNKVGRSLAKAVGIDVDYRHRNEPHEFFQSAAGSVKSVDQYFESEPTVQEWFQDHGPTRAGTARYVRSLFPFWNWIFHYNLTWLLGDVIAGVTVGFVVIPQGMAYAILAKLPPEYGLYTSFVGFLLYWTFATSKDITIGTVAVMSTLVGNIVGRLTNEHPEFAPEMIARALSVISGALLLFIGLTRLGWIVEFIPLVGITSFMTGAAINIAAGQVPALLGISGLNTRESTYRVIINTLKHLPNAKIDAAMGLTALFLLYFIRWFCEFMSRRQPNRKKMWFFIATLRMAFVILLYILISWLVNRNANWDTKKTRFKVLGPVPSGFQVHGAPTITPELLSALAPDLPATIIVLIIEHISISKSFGRINNYVINPSQELVAVGFTNILGPFLGAYPATGSFSRTAIKSKAGVRTPLAGIFTAIIVLLALYALTSVFFYIPSASLAGLIIHAVGDLITAPHVVYQFWQVSPVEVIVFFGGVLITVFTDIETGIYFTVCASAALLLFRLAKANGSFLGRVHVYRVNKDTSRSDHLSAGGVEKEQRESFIPYDHSDGSNPNVNVQTPYPGVFIYRFDEGFNYTNSGRLMDDLTAYIQAQTRPTILERYEKIGDRPWNNPGPRRGAPPNPGDSRPFLHAIILDCASVNNVDVTSIQALVDTRNQLDTHAKPDPVEWHFANVNNRWTRRAFAAAGFGFPASKAVDQYYQGRWKPIFSVAAVDAASAEEEKFRRPLVTLEDVETGKFNDRISSTEPHGEARVQGSEFPKKVVAVQGMNRPFFHIDVAAAVESAVANAEAKAEAKGGSSLAQTIDRS